MTDVTALEQDETAVDGHPRRRGARLATGVLVLLLGLVAGMLLGRGEGQPEEPPPGAVSLGFVRDMQAHHAQAVRMSEIVHRRSPDPAVNYLAFDVLSTQQGQIGK